MSPVQITEAIRRYGVADATTSLLVVRISSPEPEGVQQAMTSVVSGTFSPLDQLPNITDWPTVKRVDPFL